MQRHRYPEGEAVKKPSAKEAAEALEIIRKMPMYGSVEWHKAQQAKCRQEHKEWCREFDRARERASPPWKWREALRGQE